MHKKVYGRNFKNVSVCTIPIKLLEFNSSRGRIRWSAFKLYRHVNNDDHDDDHDTDDLDSNGDDDNDDDDHHDDDDDHHDDVDDHHQQTMMTSDWKKMRGHLDSI